MKALLFTGPNCKACPAMKHNLAKAEIHYDELDLSVKENQSIAGLYQVRGLPTLVVVNGGRPVDSLPAGVIPIDTLVQLKKRWAI